MMLEKQIWVILTKARGDDHIFLVCKPVFDFQLHINGSIGGPGWGKQKKAGPTPSRTTVLIYSCSRPSGKHEGNCGRLQVSRILTRVWPLISIAKALPLPRPRSLDSPTALDFSSEMAQTGKAPSNRAVTFPRRLAVPLDPPG